MTWKGIDVSDNQGVINWQKVKAAGVQFAVLRSVRGSGKIDYQFIKNYSGCQVNNIPVSVYKYTYADTAEKARTEAAQVVSLLNSVNAPKPTMIWWDVEDRSTLYYLGSSNLTAIIKAAKETIEAAGYRFGIYVGLYVYRENWFDFSQFTDIPLWVARYPSTTQKVISDNPSENYKPDVGRDIWGWQYSSNGRVDGISTAVDLDICYFNPVEEWPVPDTGKTKEEHGVKEFSLNADGEKQISKNFKVKEFRCKDGSDKILIDDDFVRTKLQAIRDHFGAPVTINSAYRTESYNKKVCGAKSSYHVKGQAFDIIVKGRTPLEVARYAQVLGINGIIQYNTFVHVDSRPTKYWARDNNGTVTTKSSF